MPAIDSPARAPQYFGRLPWRGPIVGERYMQDAREFIRLCVGSDPFFGNAAAAAFLPVSECACGQQYCAARPDGAGGSLDDIGWFHYLDAESGEGPPLSVPTEWWQGKVAGVLVILLYDQSPELARGGHNFFLPLKHGALEMGLHLESLGLDGYSGERARSTVSPIRIVKLPNAERSSVVSALDELLKAGASELRHGLIQIHG
jgi:hypothetical protein